MNQIRLQRHGKADLLFNGTRLAQVDDREFIGFAENWMETSLYKTSLGQFILGTTFHVTSCGHRDIHTALVFSSAEDLFDFMEVSTRPLSSLTAEVLRQASILEPAFELCSTFMPIRTHPVLKAANAQ